MLKENQWAHHYNECISCHGTKIKHQARGLCEKCYSAHRLKTDADFKRRHMLAVAKYQKNNPDKVKAAMNNFLERKYEARRLQK
jgi:hypothetical protein